MERKTVIKVPPRPEVIRERYAGFLAEQARFLENYKRNYICGMNERFALRSEGKRSGKRQMEENNVR